MLRFDQTCFAVIHAREDFLALGFARRFGLSGGFIGAAILRVKWPLFIADVIVAACDLSATHIRLDRHGKWICFGDAWI